MLDIFTFGSLWNSFLCSTILISENVEISTGQVLQGVIRSIDKAHKVVYLSSDPDTISKSVVCHLSFYCFIFLFCFLSFSLAVFSYLTFYCYMDVQTKDLKGISIDLLIPGMMVNARVQSTLENGVMLSFLTYFTGTVSCAVLFDLC